SRWSSVRPLCTWWTASVSSSSGQTSAFGAVQVALYQPERNRGPMCQGPGQFHRDSGEIFIGKDTVDQAERQRFVGLDRATGEIKPAPPGSPDQPSQKETPAEIAGKADPDKGGH